MAENRWSGEGRQRWDDDRGGRGGYRGRDWDRDDDDAADESRYAEGSRYRDDDEDIGGREDRGRYGAGYRGERSGYSGTSGNYSYGERPGRGGQQGYRGYEGNRNWFDRASDEVSSWIGDEDARRRRAADQSGPHRGRGPKGYTRSDDRIREDVSDRLSDDSSLDASEIEVTVSKGEVTLSGTVESREDKRRAEDLAETVSGVQNVQNNLRQQGANSAGRSSKSKSSQS
jgi:osmotically-inducible protein OsmY